MANGCPYHMDVTLSDPQLEQSQERQRITTKSALYEWTSRLVLEIALPSAVELRLWDGFLASNENALSALESGDAYEGKAGAVRLVTGSRAEGLAIEEHWGQEWADQDNMWIYGGPWGVSAGTKSVQYGVGNQCCCNICLNDSMREPGHGIQALIRYYLIKSNVCSNARLELDTSSCPLGYTRLRAGGDTRKLGKLMEDMTMWLQTPDSYTARECFEQSDGQFWLSSHKSLRTIEHINDEDEETIHGPAHMVGILNIEYIVALVSDHPLPCMTDYYHRVRGKSWPRQDTMNRICKLPGLVVPTGHWQSTPKERACEWRKSWSPAELLLAKDIPIWAKQGYWAFKYTLQKLLRECQSHQIHGRSAVRSYMLKTCLFYQLEEEDTWSLPCPVRMYRLLLQRLNVYLDRNFIPHYFLPNNNLLENITVEALQYSISCINKIVNDLLAAILQCPLRPSEVYGSFTPNYILQALNDFLAAESANGVQASWAKLNDVINHLEEHRKRKFKEQCLRDAPCKSRPYVTGRSSLKSLKTFMANVPPLVPYS